MNICHTIFIMSGIVFVWLYFFAFAKSPFTVQWDVYLSFLHKDSLENGPSQISNGARCWSSCPWRIQKNQRIFSDSKALKAIYWKLCFLNKISLYLQERVVDLVIYWFYIKRICISQVWCMIDFSIADRWRVKESVPSCVTAK